MNNITTISNEKLKLVKYESYGSGYEAGFEDGKKEALQELINMFINGIKHS